ncbi:MAG: hypothetical protein ABSE51_02965 [Terracidiphilus sp.]
MPRKKSESSTTNSRRSAKRRPRGQMSGERYNGRGDDGIYAV